jgi:acyl-coenzyme A thioesterase PaaI-like protein
MHVTDLEINKALGIRLPAPDSAWVLELPESPLLLNHLGTIHASAQFALAEAASGEFLLNYLGEAQNRVFAVLRASEVKFRKPAHGVLRASARFADDTPHSPSAELESRGRALASIFVEVVDAKGVVTMSGRFDWFLQRQGATVQ